jgi:outer membrane protein
MKPFLSTIWLSILTLALAFSLYLHFGKTQEIVYVDSAKLLNEYKGMKTARAEYEKKAKEWKSNIDTLTGEIQKMLLVHEKAISGMTKKERQLSEELLRTKQQQLGQYQQVIQQKAQEEDQRVTQAVLTEVNNYLKDYGKSHNYSIILATANGNIVYAEDALDITDEVIKGLNNQ